MNKRILSILYIIIACLILGNVNAISRCVCPEGLEWNVYTEQCEQSIYPDTGMPRGDYSGKIYGSVSPKGNLLYNHIDLKITNQRGPNIIIDRSYNSNSMSKGIFGYGWSFNFDFSFETKINPDALPADTQLDVFDTSFDAAGLIPGKATIGDVFLVQDKGRVDYFRREGDVYYPQQGLNDLLRIESDGSFLLTKEGGISYTFKRIKKKLIEGNFWHPTESQFDYALSGQEKLEKITDKDGNFIYFDYDLYDADEELINGIPASFCKAHSSNCAEEWEKKKSNWLNQNNIAVLKSITDGNGHLIRIKSQYVAGGQLRDFSTAGNPGLKSDSQVVMREIFTDINQDGTYNDGTEERKLIYTYSVDGEIALLSRVDYPEKYGLAENYESFEYAKSQDVPGIGTVSFTYMLKDKISFKPHYMMTNRYLPPDKAENKVYQYFYNWQSTLGGRRPLELPNIYREIDPENLDREYFYGTVDSGDFKGAQYTLIADQNDNYLATASRLADGGKRTVQYIARYNKQDFGGDPNGWLNSDIGNSEFTNEINIYANGNLQQSINRREGYFIASSYYSLKDGIALNGKLKEQTKKFRTYDENGISRIIDAEHTKKYKYTQAGKVFGLLELTDVHVVEGGTADYTEVKNQYDKKGNLIRTTNIDGTTVEYKYNAKGQVIWKKDEYKGEWNYQYYDNNGYLFRATKPDDAIEENTFDYYGNLINNTLIRNDGKPQAEQILKYNKNSEIVQKTDPLKRKETWEYYPTSLTRRHTNIYGGVEEKTYYKNLWVDTEKDVRGKSTKYYYWGEMLPRLIIQQPSNRIEFRSYDTLDRLSSTHLVVSSKDISVIRMNIDNQAGPRYDSAKITLKDKFSTKEVGENSIYQGSFSIQYPEYPFISSTRFEYEPRINLGADLRPYQDKWWQVSTVMDDKPSAFTMRQFSFIMQERPYPAGSSYKVIDGNGRVTDDCNEEGYCIKYSRSAAANGFIEKEIALPKTTLYKYDLAGKQKEIIVNGEGNSLFNYDPNTGSINEIIDPDKKSSFEYDSLGRPIKIEESSKDNSSKHVVTRKYDNYNREIQISGLGDNGLEEKEKIVYKNKDDQFGKISIDFDPVGREIKRSLPMSRPLGIKLGELKIPSDWSDSSKVNISQAILFLRQNCNLGDQVLRTHTKYTAFLDNGSSYHGDPIKIEISDINENGNFKAVITGYNISGDPSYQVIPENIDVEGRKSYDLKESYIYDAYGALVSYKDMSGKETLFEYNSAGLEERRIFSGDVITESLYYPDLSPMVQRNERGDEILYYYTKAGKISSIAYPKEDAAFQAEPKKKFWDSLTTISPINKLPELNSLRDVSVEKFEYTPDGRLSKKVGRNGATWKYEYDNFNRIKSVKTELNGEEKLIGRYTYTSSGNLDTETSGFSSIKYTWNGLNQLKAKTRLNTLIYSPELSKPVEIKENYEYDNDGNLIRSTDAKGNEYASIYDRNQNLMISRAPGSFSKIIPGATVKLYQGTRKEIELPAYTYASYYEYDDRGNIIRETSGLTAENPSGNAVKYFYDDLSRLIRVEDPDAKPIDNDNAAKTNTYYVYYDNSGNIVKERWGLVQGHDSEDPERGLPDYASDKDGLIRRYSYDSRNRLITVQEPLANEVAGSIDPLGSGEAKSWTTYLKYDCSDPSIEPGTEKYYICEYSNFGPNNLQGNKNLKAYGTSSQPLKICMDGIDYGRIDPIRQEISMDLSGDENPLNICINYSYYDDGKLQSIHYGNRRLETYNYDIFGNPIKHEDVNGLLTQWVFAPTGELEEISVSSPDALANSIQRVKYYYDGFGRIRETSTIGDDGEIVTKMAYDNNDNIISKSLVSAGKTISSESFEYDALNRPIVYTDPMKVKTRYGYDHNSNVINVTKGIYDSESGSNTGISPPENYRPVTDYYFYDDKNRIISTAISSLNEPEGFENPYYSPSMIHSNTIKNLSWVKYDERGNIRAASAGFHRPEIPSNRLDPQYTTYYDYDKMGRQIAAYYPNTEDRTIKQVERWSYSDDNMVFIYTDPTNNKSYTYFDKIGRQYKTVLPKTIVFGTSDQIEEHYRYDMNGNLRYKLTGYTDSSDGALSEYQYAEAWKTTEGETAIANLLTKTIFPSIVDMDGNEQKVIFSYGKYHVSGSPTSIVDARNNPTEIVYTATGKIKNQKTDYKDISGNQFTAETTYEYSPEGNLIRKLENGKSSATMEYNKARLPSKVILPAVTTKYLKDRGFELGQAEITYKYDPLYNVVEMTRPVDGKSAIFKYSYDELGRLIKEILPATSNPDGDIGNPTVKEGVIRKYYDPMGNLITQRAISDVDKTDGAPSYYFYNSLNQLKKQKVLVQDPLDNIWDETIYNYDNRGNIKSIADNGFTTVSYDYDALNRQIRMVGSATAAGPGPKKEFEYDALGNQWKVKEIVSGNVVETFFDYDTSGNLKKITYPKIINPDAETRNPVNCFYYDPNGNLKVKINGGENSCNLVKTNDPRFSDKLIIDKYDYDELNRVIRNTDGNQKSQLIKYNLQGQMEGQRDKKGNWVNFVYDERNQMTGIRYPDGGESWTAYTQDGAIKAIFDRNNVVVVKNFYDERGRQIRYAYPDESYKDGAITNQNIQIKNYYDQQGLVNTIDAEGKTTEFSYYKSGLLKNNCQRTNEFGISQQPCSSVSYNQFGYPTYTSDAKSNRDEMIYDESGRLYKRDYQGAQQTMIYDEQGNPISISDEENGITSIEYNSWGLPSKLIDKGIISTYNYDSLGNLRFVKTPERTINIDYDNINRLTSKVFSKGSEKVTEQLAYDDNDNIVRESSVDSFTGLGYETVYGDYDVNNQPHIVVKNLISGSSSKQADMGLTYDMNGKVKKIDISPAGSAAFFYEYAYDNLGRIKEIKDSQGKTALSYNKNGLRNGLYYPNGNSITYDYNDRNLVDSMTYNLGDSFYLQLGYDPNGNLVDVFKDANPSPIQHYVYDNRNRLLSFSDMNNRNEIYDYANNGARLSKTTGASTSYYNYDATKDKLDSISGQTPKSFAYDNEGNINGLNGISLTYDPKGRVRTVTSTSGTWTYGYDSMNNRVAKRATGKNKDYLYNGQNIVLENENGNIQRYLTLGIDEIISKTSSAGTDYYFYDGQDNVMGIRGTQTKDYSYTPFGEILTGYSSTDKNNYLFAGREYDQESGLYFFRNRYYDPSTGRFLQRDPNPANPITRPDEVNRYPYAANNPVMYRDPDGRLIPLVVLLPVILGGTGLGVGIGLEYTDQPGSWTEKDWSSIAKSGAIGGGVGVAAGLSLGYGIGIAGAAVPGSAAYTAGQAMISSSSMLAFKQYDYWKAGDNSFHPMQLGAEYMTGAAIGAMGGVYSKFATPLKAAGRYGSVAGLWAGSYAAEAGIFTLNSYAQSQLGSGHEWQGIENEFSQSLMMVGMFKAAGLPGSFAPYTRALNPEAAAITNNRNIVGKVMQDAWAHFGVPAAIQGMEIGFSSGNSEWDWNRYYSDVIGFGIMHGMGRYGNHKVEQALKAKEAQISPASMRKTTLILEDKEIAIKDSGQVDRGIESVCFLAGTPITMANMSEKNIDEIKVGDKVLSYDTDKQTVVNTTVIQLFIRNSTGYMIVNNRIEVTPNHPFYIDGEWKRADELQFGDCMMTADEACELVTSLEFRPHEKVIVYNFEVSKNANLSIDSPHDYFASGVMVHNTCWQGNPEWAKQKDYFSIRGVANKEAKKALEGNGELGRVSGSESNTARMIPGARPENLRPAFDVTTISEDLLPQAIERASRYAEFGKGKILVYKSKSRLPLSEVHQKASEGWGPEWQVVKLPAEADKELLWGISPPQVQKAYPLTEDGFMVDYRWEFAEGAHSVFGPNHPLYAGEKNTVFKDMQKSLNIKPMEGCFLANTSIKLADEADIFIQDINPGDTILAFDFAKNISVPAKVTNTFIHNVTGYLIINERLKVTPNHPMFINGDWKEAGDAKTGDCLYDENMNCEKIISINYIDENVTVYNLEVADFHDYFAQGVLVHNKAAQIADIKFKDESMADTVADTIDLTSIPEEMREQEAFAILSLRGKPQSTETFESLVDSSAADLVKISSEMRAQRNPHLNPNLETLNGVPLGEIFPYQSVANEEKIHTAFDAKGFKEKFGEEATFYRGIRVVKGTKVQGKFIGQPGGQMVSDSAADALHYAIRPAGHVPQGIENAKELVLMSFKASAEHVGYDPTEDLHHLVLKPDVDITKLPGYKEMRIPLGDLEQNYLSRRSITRQLEDIAKE